MNSKLSHITETGDPTMVDVSSKQLTDRLAVAEGEVVFPEKVFTELLAANFLGEKGAIVQTATIAGIMGARKTFDLIPLCHLLELSHTQVEIMPKGNRLEVRCTVRCQGKTGVEMEALTGVSIAALTLYDMCKALSHDIQIGEIKLKQKKGGKRNYERT